MSRSSSFPTTSRNRGRASGLSSKPTSGAKSVGTLFLFLFIFCFLVAVPIFFPTKNPRLTGNRGSLEIYVSYWLEGSTHDAKARSAAVPNGHQSFDRLLVLLRCKRGFHFLTRLLDTVSEGLSNVRRRRLNHLARRHRALRPGRPLQSQRRLCSARAVFVPQAGDQEAVRDYEWPAVDKDASPSPGGWQSEGRMLFGASVYFFHGRPAQCAGGDSGAFSVRDVATYKRKP